MVRQSTIKKWSILTSIGFGFTALVCQMILFSFTVVCAATSPIDKHSDSSSAVYIHTKEGKVSLYKKSYALLIGISEYDKGWPLLPGVKEDLTAIKKILESHGFKVVTVENPNSDALKTAFERFIKQYAMDFDNRLLFYFSGHGHTEAQTYGDDMGYIIPKDAPLPHKDRNQFHSKALSLQQFEVYARTIQSKHALFVFDSCFSGSVFSASRSVPEAISYKTQNPVRQFITSGSKDEFVPDDSVFRYQFVSGLKGEADLNQDGYITSSELGLYLENTVIEYSKNMQHPQYGKIRNPHLDKGDLVFQVNDLDFRLSIDQDEGFKTKNRESNLIWHVTAISLACSTAVLSYLESEKYNELKTENKAISNNLNGLSSIEYKDHKQQYDENSSHMDQPFVNIYLLDFLTLSALVWEGYLIYSDFFSTEDEESLSEQMGFRLAVHPFIRTAKNNHPKFSFTYQFKW